MKKKNYWKDIRQAVTGSIGRFISITALMALGSFALVGLNVTGPDIRETGQNYFHKYKTADLAVMSDYGLDKNDQNVLNALNKKATVEYGYLVDATVGNSDTAFRIFSQPKEISKYQLVQGRFPQNTKEIALQASYKNKYKLGDKISFTEKVQKGTSKVLKEKDFTIVGFVHSSEMISNSSLGATTVGTGGLNGYALVTPEAFDSKVYMISRIAYKDLRGLSPYSEEYLEKVQGHKKEVEKLIKNQSASRLATIKVDGEKEISDAEKKLADGKKAITDADKQLSDGRSQVADGEKQLSDGRTQIGQAEQQLANARQEISQGQASLQSAWQTLQGGKAQLDQANAELVAADNELAVTAKELQVGESQLQAIGPQVSEYEQAKKTLEASKTDLATKEAEYQVNAQLLAQQKAQLQAEFQAFDTALTQLRQELEQEESKASPDATIIASLQAQIATKEAEKSAYQVQYNLAMEGLAVIEAQLAEAAQELESARNAIAQGEAQLAENSGQIAEYYQKQEELAQGKAIYRSKLSEYQAGYQEYQTARASYYSGLEEWFKGAQELEKGTAEYKANASALAEAKQLLAGKEQELADGKESLAKNQKKFDQEKIKADKDIQKAETDIADGKDALKKLDTPTYSVYTRREVPGSEGYVSYTSNANIVDSIGKIFPIVLYFVAALVTVTTMTRYVDEERIKAGTFKALGYTNSDIIRKFVIYGGVASLVGTVVGTLAGHTLLPLVVYSTYGLDITLPVIELHFYPFITLLAIGLALASAVLPAYLVAKKELSAQPAQLLLAKPPVAGDKILLERITPLWKRMSFTQKVTARNIFRYKQRMLMTIFGVCGSIALLFAGLGVRGSISDLNNRQFGELIKYDMIVADKNHLSDKESKEVSDLLDKGNVKEHLPIYYEELNKEAGESKDRQSITMIVPQKGQGDKFQNFVGLESVDQQQKLKLDNKGVIISQKLADLLHAKVGDKISLKDANNKERKFPIAGITEMYMGHFVFMSPEVYQEVFGKSISYNARMILLKDNSSKATKQTASDFIKLSAVKGVLQNSSLKEAVRTIVDALNQIMMIMITVSIMLAVVILYNLTNINVSERIRELCTIKVLGFHNKEVTLYIYRETIVLSLVGILVGFGLGTLLHHYMISFIPPSDVMFDAGTHFTVCLSPTSSACDYHLDCIGLDRQPSFKEG